MDFHNVVDKPINKCSPLLNQSHSYKRIISNKIYVPRSNQDIGIKTLMTESVPTFTPDITKPFNIYKLTSWDVHCV